MSLAEEHRMRNSRYVQTLVDCGCVAIVWKDGSGVEIEYCPMHKSASDLLEALKDTHKLLDDIHEHGIDWQIIGSIAMMIEQVIAKVEGGE